MPLIGLGLVDTVEEVQKLIERVDDDKSGEIEFNEFLKIILSFNSNKVAKDQRQSNVMTQFIQDLTSGKFKTSGLSFSNWVLTTQR